MGILCLCVTELLDPGRDVLSLMTIYQLASLEPLDQAIDTAPLTPLAPLVA